MRSSPSGITSATTAITLAVPMSRPTTRSLISLAILLSLLLLLRLVGGVGRSSRRPSAAPRSRRCGAGRRIRAGAGSATVTWRTRARRSAPRARAPRRRCRGRARRPRRCRASPATSRGPRARAPRRARRAARTPARRAPSIASTCAELPSGPASVGRVVVLDVADVGLEHLAEAVDELLGAARRRPRSRPAGAPRAAPRRRFGQTRRTTAMAHPRHRLEGARAPREVDRQEVAGELRRGVGADRRDAVAADVAVDADRRGSRTAAGAPARAAPSPASSDRGDDARARRRSRSSGARRPAAASSSAGGRARRPCGQAPGRGASAAGVERRAGEQLQAERLVADAGGARRHRHQRVRGHARRGVHLEQEGLAVAARAASGRRGPSRGSRACGRPARTMRWISRLLVGRQAARALVADDVGEVLVLVVVLALGRDDAHHRQRARAVALAEHRAGHLVAVDELLAQHVGVVASPRARPRPASASSRRPW